MVLIYSAFLKGLRIDFRNKVIDYFIAMLRSLCCISERQATRTEVWLQKKIIDLPRFLQKYESP